jgi:hypothetical protein
MLGMTEDSAATYLVGKGWPQLAAQAIVAHSGVAPTKSMIPASRWERYVDWVSSVERNVNYPSAALAYLDYELRNSFESLGTELRKATRLDTALAAIAPYWGRPVKVRFLTLEEARQRGYTDPGNPELRR